MRTQTAIMNFGCLWLLAISASMADAAAPVVRNVNLRGLQAGVATTLVLEGVNLLPDPRIVMPLPIAAQQVRPGATPEKVEIDITLDSSVTPGLYNLYLATEAGLSEKVLVSVDRLKQQAFGTPVEALPAALHGAISGSTTLRTKFTGQPGQAIVCEVEAQRLGGKLRPVLHLYDPSGKHLAWSLPQTTLRGDTRLTTSLPVAGEYALTLNDLQYAAQSPNHFRLKIGSWEYADQVFPLAVERGKPATLKLIGFRTTTQAALSTTPDAWRLLVPWTDPTTASGPRPSAMVSELPELVEPAGATDPVQLATLGIAFNGWLATPAEEDRYRVQVEPGSRLRIEVWADRLGSPLDSVLQVLDDKGNVLGQNDEFGPSADAAVDYQVPAEMTVMNLKLRDVQGRGGESFVYRIVVARADKPVAGDFQLLIERDACNLSPSGQQLLKVSVDRRGYQGPIQLEFDRLPPGIKAEGTEIPAGATAALVALSGAATPTQWFSTLRGRALDPAQPAVRIARWEPMQPGSLSVGMTDEVALAMASAASQVAIPADWQSPNVKLTLGSKIPATIKCVRPVGYDGPVRVSLLTTQNPPRNNGAIDENRTLRMEQGATIEIPPDGAAVAAWDAKLAADKQLVEAQTAQVAADKALADLQQQAGANTDAAVQAKAEVDKRATEAEQKKVAAEQAAKVAADAAKNDLEFKLVVPAELPDVPHGIALRAELLSRDRQIVLATVCTSVRPLPVVNPLVVRLDGPPQLQMKLDAAAGATVKLTGKIERLEGLASDVNVSVIGLPGGIGVPAMTLKPDQVDFALELKFPPTHSPGKLPEFKLFATGKLDPQAPIENRSKEVPISLELLPAG